MSALISGRNVVKKYDGLTAVAGVDFDIAHGECFGFLGPNGAGKTSVMKMIQCLMPLTGGSITVADMDVTKESRSIKGILGVAPQDNSLDPDLTVEKNLEIYARYFGIPKDLAQKRTAELLEFFHLTEKRRTKIRQLSGGMQRRLVIARALINDPRTLILDEPTTGLDPAARRVIWRKLKNLKESGVTMLLTTHYMEEAAILCDRIAMMDGGKILATGKPADLVEEKVGPFVAEIKAEDEETIKTFTEKLETAEHSFEVTENVLSVFTKEPQQIADILGVEEEKVTIRPSTLEDLFFAITGRPLEEERQK